MNDKKNIIEVYKKRKYNEFLIEKRENEDTILKEDGYCQIVNDFKNKVKDMLVKAGKTEVEIEGILEAFYFPDLKTEETRQALKDNEKEFKDKMDERNRLVEEVEAQLMIVETYEQEIEILKKYGILKQDGTIYDYK